MARGVDEVLSHYFETSRSAARESERGAAQESARESPDPSGTPGAAAAQTPRPPAEAPKPALVLPWTPRGVVEPFLVWNLQLALLDHGVELCRTAVASRDSVALVLQHASPHGTRLAARRVAGLPPHQSAAVVVYGESADVRNGSWLRRLAERSGPRKTPLLHCGGVATGTELARALVRGGAVVRRPAPRSLGDQLRAAAGALAEQASAPSAATPPARQ